MADRLQDKLACDKCASSDVKFYGFGEGDASQIVVVLICGRNHTTTLTLTRR